MNLLLSALMCLTQFFIDPLTLMRAPDVVTQAERGARRSGSISGQVTADGRPIAGVGVVVRKASPVSGSGRSVATDEEGRFQVDELTSGAYFVGAGLAGYVPAGESVQTRYHRLGDFVTVRLTKGGVITGTVATSIGEPVVAARVVAALVRDSNGRPLRQQGGPSAFTDDRGVYRIYGLQSGSYVVCVNGGGQFVSTANVYGGDVPVYHPSGTRDAAAEVPVLAGQEATGVDVRYRADRGYAISGTLAGATGSESTLDGGFSILLIESSTNITHASAFISPREQTRSFALYGVPDGDYQLIAQFNAAGDGSAASPPRRVTVKGADVTGIQLALAPLGSITGRITLEALPEGDRKSECKDLRPGLVDEAMVLVRRDQKADKESPGVSSRGGDGALDEKGEFVVHRLVAGRYHIGVDLPEKLFVRKITFAGVAPAREPTDVTRDGLSIVTGQRRSGLSIEVAEGAAGLHGKVTTLSGGASSGARVRVHLVPAEPEAADTALRFFEALVNNDGGFSLVNVAPGRYFVLARAVGDDEWADRVPRRAAWDAATRAALRREAEAVNVPMEFQRCQRIADFEIKYSAPASPRRRPARKAR